MNAYRAASMVIALSAIATVAVAEGFDGPVPLGAYIVFGQRKVGKPKQ